MTAEMIIWLLWWLLVAHVIADWCIQGDYVATNKGKHSIIMLAHCIAWAGIVCIPLAIFKVLVWQKIPFLVVGHFVIDSWKVQQQDNTKFLRHLCIDQALHICQLLVVAF